MPNTREMELLVNKAFQNSVKNYGAIYAPYVARDLLDCGVTVQQWIPVTERLPEDNGRYLCNVKSFAFPGCFYQAILQCDKHGFKEGNIYTDDVTHWMPLPQPPKGD